MNAAVQEKLAQDEKVLAESQKEKRGLISNIVATSIFLVFVLGLAVASFIFPYLAVLFVFEILLFIGLLINLAWIICQYCVVTVVVTDKRVFVRSSILSSLEELSVAEVDKMFQGVGYSYSIGVTNKLTVVYKDQKKKVKGISNADELCSAFQDAKKLWADNATTENVAPTSENTEA